MSELDTVRGYCLTLLESGDLATKLRPPQRADGGPLDDDSPGDGVVMDGPARAPELQMAKGGGKLPPLDRLRDDPSARAVCLERFAHHELIAVELFAWALVTWPDMPRPMRRGMLSLIADEQRHLRLYLGRLRALGSGLGDSRLSGYLWRYMPSLRERPNGPLSFVSAMGLTFEQANLDFAAMFRDAFARAGDDPSAAVLEQVYVDEIGHVRKALEWLRRLKRPDQSDVEAYVGSVPYPLGAARAKGRRFDEEARRRAGFDDAFIELVRSAAPPDRPRPGERPPDRNAP